MTPEERAAEIVGNLTDTLERWDGSTNAWAGIIASALRTARNEALEEAAKVADDKCARTLATQYPDADPSGLDFKSAVNVQTRMAAVLLPDVATAIRALKGET